jgi:translocation and assembly module TamB
MRALRQRGIARRRLLAWLLGVPLALALLALLALSWLLRSESGLRFVLDRAVAALPPGALSVEQVRGRLAGPIELHGLRLVDAGFELRIERLQLEPRLAALWSRRLELARVQAQGLDLRLREGGVDAEPPAPWPETLPPIELPLDLVLRELRVVQARLHPVEGEPLNIDSLQVALSLEQGRLVLRQLLLRGDPGELRGELELDTRRRYQHRLALDWQAAARADDGDPARLRLRGVGDLDALRLNLDGSAPGEVHLQLDLRQPLREAAFELELALAALDPTHLSGAEAGEVIALTLRAVGNRHAARIEGELGVAGQQIGIAPSQLRWGEGRLDFDPLDLRWRGGEITLGGGLALDQAPLGIALQARWKDLPIEDGGALAAGSASLVGHPEDYRIEGEARLRRDGREVALHLLAQGDGAGLRIERLDAESASGRLALDGELAWQPALSWQLGGALDGFDPGDFLQDWPGAIDARLATRGAQHDRGLELALDLTDIGGELRGRALGGELRYALAAGGEGRLDASLRVGASRIAAAGLVGERLDLGLNLSPLQLDDLLPGAGGRLAGELRLRGDPALPGVRGRLEGSALQWQELGLARLTADFDWPETAQGEGSLRIEARQLEVGGQAIEELALALEGSQRAHRLELRARAEGLSLAAGLAGGWEQDWRGHVTRLDLAAEGKPSLALEQAAGLQLGAEVQILEPACLQVVDNEGRLCFELERRQALRGSARLQALPLALAEPWLEQALAESLRVYGSLDGEAEFEVPAGGAPRATLRLASERGGLAGENGEASDLLGYRGLRLQGGLDETGATLSLASDLAAGGHIEADLHLADLTPGAALSGTARARFEALAWLELLSPELAATQGRAQADLSLGGSLAAPAIELLAMVEDFGAEVPALGLSLREGRIALRSLDARRLALDAALRSGPGTLSARGEIDLAEVAEERLRLDIAGENVQVANTLDIKARISPELTAALSNGQLRIDGRVGLPWARIDLAHFESSTGLSPDVRVLDPNRPEAGARLPLRADITVTVGDDVRLKGFGLDGRLTGSLRVQERPGRTTSGSGALDVTGSFRGYGQNLSIVRGGLSYSASPLDNPALNIRAQREVDGNTVGVQVRGTAQRPETTLWSEPAMDQAEVLSYLVLGRSLSRASGADGAQLDAASLALGAGGRLLGDRIGQRLGMDEFGVSESAALGGSAFTVGKFLSPRLYVSYGVSLFGTGQVLSFKYLVTRSLEAQVDSGVENRASLNYRLER